MPISYDFQTYPWIDSQVSNSKLHNGAQDEGRLNYLLYLGMTGSDLGLLPILDAFLLPKLDKINYMANVKLCDLKADIENGCRSLMLRSRTARYPHLPPKHSLILFL